MSSSVRLMPKLTTEDIMDMDLLMDTLDTEDMDILPTDTDMDTDMDMDTMDKYPVPLHQR